MRHRDEEGRRPPSRRLRAAVGAATVLLVAAFVVAVLVSAATGGRSVPLPTGTPRAGGPTSTPTASAAAASTTELYVHVTGAVGRPGLVRVPAGARVVDAIEAAGGLAEGAEPAAVNLARRVQDGEQVRVPLAGEPAEAGPAGASGSAGAAGGAGGGPIDLNTATAAQLETLPRIGPALAQRIVDWRQSNGRFAAVTDLLRVAGIGQAIFDGLKDRVGV